MPLAEPPPDCDRRVPHGRDGVTLSPVNDDHYEVLGVEKDVDARTLRAAYLARMRVHHPDLRPGDAGERARQLNRAYEVLRDPARRAAYDRLRRARQASSRRLSYDPHARVFDMSGATGPDTARTRTNTTGVATGGRRVGPRGSRYVADAAYSEENQRYYHSVTAALLRIGAVTFAVGVVLILLLSR